MTPEEQYREDVLAINAAFPKGSADRERERIKRWRRFESEVIEPREADEFERHGENLSVIHRPQHKFAIRYFALVASFYNGEIDDATYKSRRVQLLRQYAQRLFELGLLTAVFDKAWVRDFARDSLRRERQLLPVKNTGFTDDDAWILCNPLRKFSHRFFSAVHSEFGKKRLRNHPDIFVGVELQVREVDALPTERLIR